VGIVVFMLYSGRLDSSAALEKKQEKALGFERGPKPRALAEPQNAEKAIFTSFMTLV
jgi:hypothetical protein